MLTLLKDPLKEYTMNQLSESNVIGASLHSLDEFHEFYCSRIEDEAVLRD
jgi:hypothetical protein